MEKLEEIKQIAFLAGEILLKYRGGILDIQTKSHAKDFVTQADKESDALIRSRLESLFPDDQILSEESSHKISDYSGRVWIADPLDATAYYITGHDTFSVMIGLAVNGRSTFGLVYAPVLKEYYWAHENEGAWKQDADGLITKLSVSDVSDLNRARFVVSPSFTGQRPIDSFVNSIAINQDYVRLCSGGLKAAIISEGKAEVIYYELGSGGKWDFCASDIILREAGGMFTDMNGQLMDYSVPDSDFTKRLVGTNKKLHKLILDRFHQYNNHD